MEPLLQLRPPSLIEMEVNERRVEVNLTDDEDVLEAPFSLKRILHYGLCALVAGILTAGVAGLDHIFVEGGAKANGHGNGRKIWKPSPIGCNPARPPKNLPNPLCRLEIKQGNAKSKVAGGQVAIQIQNADNISCSYAAISLRFNMSKTSVTEADIGGSEKIMLPPKWATTSSALVDSLLPYQTLQAKWAWFGPHRPTFQMEFCVGGFYKQLDDPIDNQPVKNMVEQIDYQWSPEKITLKLFTTTYTMPGAQLALDIEGIPMNEMETKSQAIKSGMEFTGCVRPGLGFNTLPGYGPIHCSWSKPGPASRQMSWQFVRSTPQKQDGGVQVFTQKIALTELELL